MFALGLASPKETNTPMKLRDSIRTLLGPKPPVNTAFGITGSAGRGELEIHKNALIAYRARVVALMNILEGTVTVPANKPIAQAPERKMCGRKPMAAAGLIKVRSGERLKFGS
jgi:hypothetical protein